MNYQYKKNEKYGYYSADPIPTEQELSDFYAAKYYQDNEGAHATAYSEDHITYAKVDCQVMEFLFKQTGNTDKPKILDAGCGEGFQSSYFNERDWDVTCTDYSSFGISNHNPKLMPNFVKGDIKNLNNLFAGQQFSLILLKNVLEHVTDPVQALKSIRDLMHKDSILYINVPNDFSDFQNYLMEQDLTPNTWFCPPQHLQYFQFDSLRALLEDLGFEIISMQAGFPIEQFLLNENSNYVQDRTRGRGAHVARCKLSNYFAQYDLASFIELREAYAKLSFGRDVISFVKLAN